jgi:ParB family protein of integrating conjugative element (PFGI_1 class)
MLLTLDQLAPYELDPRIMRNPKYDEIKASIRERGLDSPPTVTRRPGHGKYIIRNGGNTRLAILRELWTEIKDERFYRISCLFKPWRNEITALTGHLSENELRGGLTFIEKSLGVEKARELYEKESGKPLSQSELARRLVADGFPVPQPHISRMQEAVMYLLPAIPNALYSGLGRHQVEKLTSLRNAAQRLWDQRSANLSPVEDYQSFFHEMLSGFDGPSGSFSIQRVQDELIGRLAETFNADYDTLALALSDVTHLQALISAAPSTNAETPSIQAVGKDESQSSSPPPAQATQKAASAEAQSGNDEGTVPPQTRAPKTPVRQQADTPSFSAPATSARKTQPMASHALRVQSFQLAQGLAGAIGQSHAIVQSNSGAGFILDIDSVSIDAPVTNRIVLALLACISDEIAGTAREADAGMHIDGRALARVLMSGSQGGAVTCLDDTDLNGLFDLIWLMRQLRNEQPTTSSN